MPISFLELSQSYHNHIISTNRSMKSKHGPCFIYNISEWKKQEIKVLGWNFKCYMLHNIYGE